ncbi:MAG: CRISPR-associated helicase Cas3' [Nitrospira sp.]|nr:CRISPR-associated helicase Cas3' [Nitrospira sp.]
MNRKRSLLATFGLGTVDQAFLGVLYLGIFFLRLFALAGKTVIFDEIHAYDVYMSRLFRRLLAWLRALDTHVILLSATLPAGLRNELISAWGAKPETEAAAGVPYPAVWSISEGQCHRLTNGLTPAWGQYARLIRHDTDPEAIAASVVAALETRATVGVICNTVNRAQKVYMAIRERLPEGMDEEDVLLFHARYLFHARQTREKHAGERFGKTRPDLRPAILVATQVAEQSLDLDFDVLFTDIAPIDLLLQRAGRLHRHTRLRPEAFASPILYWHCPETEEGTLPDLSEVGVRTSEYSVYEPLIVWKTWRVLYDREAWELPADYRTLIEAVYDGDMATPAGLSAVSQQEWAKGQKRFQDNTSRANTHANERMVPEPTEDGMWDLLLLSEPTLADPDDEVAHASRKALTRDGEESIEAIALYSNAWGKLHMDPACTRPALRMQKEGEAGLSLEEVRALLDNAIRISYQNIATALREPHDRTILEWWQSRTAETPALLYRYPLVLDNRTWACSGYQVRDDDELGLIISRI